jgi:protein SPT2
MTSKVDFGTLLAKADKNTNNAQKLLKEQDHLKRIKLEEQRKAEKQREAALSIINKKKQEEALKQANKTLSTSNAAKASPLSQVEKKSDSTPVNKSNGSSSFSNSKANTKPQQQSKNHTIKNNDKKPQVSQSVLSRAANDNNKKLNVNKNGTPKTKKPVASAPAKPKLTFEEMLKLADVKQKELTEKSKPIAKQPSLAAQSLMPSFKSKATKDSDSSLNPPSSANLSKKLPTSGTNKLNPNKSDSNFKKPLEPNVTIKASDRSMPRLSAQQSSNSVVSKLTPEQIEKLRIRQQGNKSQANQSISNKPNISNHGIGRDNEQKRPQIPNGSSAKSGWDLAMSYVKKKDVKNSHPIQRSHNDELNYMDEEDEDEYDSEMDDFIDDEEQYESKEKGYSKYIREIFKYNPDKYKDDDDDDLANMETDFHSQLKEESRSLRLGIMEDLEEERKEAERLARLKQGKRKSESDDINKKRLKS